MNLKDSPLAGKATHIYNLDSGEVYFYDNFLITEFREGLILVKENLLEVINLIHKHFGFNKPYGLISHRLNSYSINLSDIHPVVSEFGNLVANAVVAYSSISLKNFELEKQLLDINGKAFINMDDALKWTQDEIAKSVNNNDHKKKVS